MRVETIRLYRQMLREIRRIESVPSREQLKRWIREEFESARHLKDEVRWLSSQGLVHQCVSVLSLVITSVRVCPLPVDQHPCEAVPWAICSAGATEQCDLGKVI